MLYSTGVDLDVVDLILMLLMIVMLMMMFVMLGSNLCEAHPFVGALVKLGNCNALSP